MPEIESIAPKQTSDRMHVLWYFLAAMLVLFGLLLVQTLSRERDTLLELEEHRLLTQVRTLDINFAQELDSIVNALHDVAIESREWHQDIGVRAAGARRFHAIVELLPGVRTINLLDANGIVQASNRNNLVGSDFSQREYFRAAHDANSPTRVILSPPFRTVLDVLGMNLAVVIPGSHGEFAGAVTATLDKTFFETLLDSVRYAQDMHTGVLHGTGAPFALATEAGISNKPDDTIVPKELIDQFLRDKVPEKAIRQGAFAGEERMVVMRVVSPARLNLDNGLIVAASRRFGEIHAQWWRHAATETVTFLIVALSAVLALGYYIRRQRVAEFKLASANAHRRKAKRDLVESEGRLRRSLEYANIGSWEWDIAADTITWSETTYGLFGLKAGAFKPSFEAFLATVHPDDRLRVKSTIENCVEFGNTYEIEHRCIWPDGSIGWIHERGGVTRDEAMRPVRMSGVSIDITDRKHIEQTLRKWADAFEYCAHGIVLVEPDENRIVACNPAFSRILRRSRDAIIGTSIFVLCTEEDQAEFKVAIANADADVHSRIEAHVPASDGRSVPVQIDLESVRDRGGTLLYRVATVQDITERRRAAEELRASEERLRRVAASMNDVVYTLDTEQRHTALYGTWVKRGGLQESHFLGRSVREVFGASAAAVHEAANQRAISGEDVVYEWSIVTSEGEQHFQTSVSPLRDSRGSVTGVVGVGRDITERINAEQKVRDGEATLRGFFDSAPFMMGIIEFVNDEVVVVASNATDERYFSSSTHAVHSALVPRRLWLSQYRQALSTQRPVRFECPVTVNAMERHLSVTIAPVTSKSVHPRCCYIVEDITERYQLEEKQRRLQAQLQQSQKMEMIGQLTGGIAHDFNNILASILGFTNLSRDRYGSVLPPKVRDYLDEVKRATRRAADLVAKMLAFARNSKRATQVIQPLEQVQDVVGMLAAVFPASMRITIQRGVPTAAIRADRVALHESLTNLLINARDALSGRGSIVIALASRQFKDAPCASCHGAFHGEFVEIAIRDDGCGIPPDVLPRIFEPFYTTKDVGRGSGMGLAMVHGLVHESGGHIQVESEVGVGTTVRMFFPAVHSAAERDDRQGAPTSVFANSVDGKVLVVDDEDSLCRLLDDLLTEYGYRPEVCTDPRAALEKFRAAPADYAALITDYTMPGMTGGELARETLAIRADLPIILCTGYSDEMNAEVSQHIGIRRFFYKPVLPDDLLSALAEITVHPETMELPA